MFAEQLTNKDILEFIKDKYQLDTRDWVTRMNGTPTVFREKGTEVKSIIYLNDFTIKQGFSQAVLTQEPVSPLDFRVEQKLQVLYLPERAREKNPLEWRVFMIEKFGKPYFLQLQEYCKRERQNQKERPYDKLADEKANKLYNYALLRNQAKHPAQSKLSNFVGKEAQTQNM